MKNLVIILLLISFQNCLAQLFTPTLHSDTITLSSSEVAGLFTTPKQIIPAPGVNKMIFIQRVAFFCNYNTHAFTSTGKANLYYGNIPFSLKLITDLTCVTQTQDVIMIVMNGMNPVQTIQKSQIVNQPIMLKQSSPITGPGDLKIKVYIIYQIVNL